MKRTLWVAWMAAAVVICLVGAALAQEERVSAQGVPYVSGGVGLDERTTMTDMAARYNLRLEFALTNRDYLGAVQVTLKGPATLEAVSDGPWFMAKLPPGEYRLTAVADGAAKSEKVSVPATGMKTLVLHW